MPLEHHSGDRGATGERSSLFGVMRGTSATISENPSEKIFFSTVHIDPRCQLGFEYLQRGDARKVIDHLQNHFDAAAHYFLSLERGDEKLAQFLKDNPNDETALFVMSKLRQFLRDYRNQNEVLAELKEEQKPTTEVLAHLARVLKLEKELDIALTHDGAGRFLQEFSDEIARAQLIFEQRFNDLECAAKICANLSGSAADSGVRMYRIAEIVSSITVVEPSELTLFNIDSKSRYSQFNHLLDAAPVGFRALRSVFESQLASLEIIRQQLENLRQTAATLIEIESKKAA